MVSYEPVRMPRQEELTVRGLKHRLTWWGERTATPIVLLHGFMDCGATWQFLVDQLPNTWSLVAPDWRGFGGTEWAPGGYWFPDYLADLDVMLDALVPGGRARVIGHSMGANISTLYAGIRPKRLEWLVNLEGIGLPRTQPDMAPGHYATWLDEVGRPQRDSRYRSLEQFASVLKQRNPGWPEDRAEFVARAWSRDAGEDGAVRVAFDPRHRYVNPVLYQLDEAEACWSRIEVPMMIVTGGSSGHLQRRGKAFTPERIRELFRDVRFVTLPGLGHMMHYESPAAVAGEIITFEQMLT